MSLTAVSNGFRVVDKSEHAMNLFLLGYGPTGSAKTLPVSQYLRRILHTASHISEKNVTLPFDNSSLEGLISLCAQEKIFSGLAVHDEFSSLLNVRKNTNHYMKDIDGILTHLHDGTGYDRVTRYKGKPNHEVIPPESYYSIVSTTTNNRVISLLDEDWFINGAGVRFLYEKLPPTPRRKLSAIKADDQFILNCASFLIGLNSFARQKIPFDDDALNLYEEYFNNIEDIRVKCDETRELIADYLNRIGPEFLPKIAGLKAMSNMFVEDVRSLNISEQYIGESIKHFDGRNDEEIINAVYWRAFIKEQIDLNNLKVTKEDVQYSFGLIKKYLKNYQNILETAVFESGQSELDAIKQKIMNYLMKHGKTPEGRLKNKCRLSDIKRYEEAKKELLSEHKIAIEDNIVSGISLYPSAQCVR